MNLKNIQTTVLVIILGAFAAAKAQETSSLLLQSRASGPPARSKFEVVVPPPEYSVSTASNPTNGGTTKGGGTLAMNTSTTLSAKPSKGFVFVNWTIGDAVVGTNTTLNFDPNADVTATANFGFTVSAAISPADAGAITGKGPYTAGSTVTLTANPDGCYEFSRWLMRGESITNNPYTFPITNNISLVAEFTRLEYTVTVAPSDQGTVIGAGKKECGSKVTIAAIPKRGFKFLHFIDMSDNATLTNRTFVVDSDRSFQAVFQDIQPPTLTITSPTPGLKVFPFATLGVSGKAADNVAVEYVDYSLNGSPWGPVDSLTSNGDWAVMLDLAPNATNTLLVKAVDTSNNSKTNKLVFDCTAPSIAPPSMLNLVGQLNLNNQSPYEISFGDDTFAQISPGANGNSAIGFYTYTVTGTNTAQLIRYFNSPPPVPPVSLITLTFSDPFTATITDPNNDTGTIAFSPVLGPLGQGTAPSSLAGITTIFTSGSNPSDIDTNVFDYNTFTAGNSAGTQYGGTYAFTQYSPLVGFLQEVITNDPYSGASNFVIMRFNGNGETNTYSYTGYSNSGGAPQTDFGTFEDSGHAAAGFAPASLSGSAWEFQQKDVPNYVISFDDASMAVISDNSSYFGIADYFYTRTGSNTAEISWAYWEPYAEYPTFTPSAAAFTFTSSGSAIYTNFYTSETGTLTSSPVRNTAPVWLAINKITLKSVTKVQTEIRQITFNLGTFKAENISSRKSGFGAYTYTIAAKNTAFVQMDYQDTADPGLIESLQLNFETPITGTFVTLQIGESGGTETTGTFTLY